MKRRIKTVVLLVLIAVIAFGLTACGDSVKKKPESQATLPAPAAETETVQNSPAPESTGEIQLPPLA